MQEPRERDSKCQPSALLSGAMWAQVSPPTAPEKGGWGPAPEFSFCRGLGQGCVRCRGSSEVSQSSDISGWEELAIRPGGRKGLCKGLEV